MASSFGLPYLCQTEESRWEYLKIVQRVAAEMKRRSD
jgi:hypothetical protein